jgi:hypothetical protein
MIVTGVAVNCDRPSTFSYEDRCEQGKGGIAD